jgi:hypothetical protein
MAAYDNKDEGRLGGPRLFNDFASTGSYIALVGMNGGSLAVKSKGL